MFRSIGELMIKVVGWTILSLVVIVCVCATATAIWAFWLAVSQ